MMEAAIYRMDSVIVRIDAIIPLLYLVFNEIKQKQ
jgi:hypothetical protein